MKSIGRYFELKSVCSVISLHYFTVLCLRILTIHAWYRCIFQLYFNNVDWVNPIKPDESWTEDQVYSWSIIRTYCSPAKQIHSNLKSASCLVLVKMHCKNGSVYFYGNTISQLAKQMCVVTIPCWYFVMITKLAEKNNLW